jgi:glycerophosphoryl diester phosphodiesterase
MKKRWVALGATAFAACGTWLGNTPAFSERPAGEPVLLAHRGLAQGYQREGLTGETCTAERMTPPRHDFIENTLRSMEAAFTLGADVIEFDVHPTTGGQFAVFHDWTVDCRTESTGRTRDHSLTALKAMDIGYGYTADGGRTFPFRGKGVGLMPSLDEVLAAFPGRRFHINVKSNDAAEGEALGAYLSRLSPEERSRATLVGTEEPLVAAKKLVPDIRTLSRRALVSCIPRYAAFGWSGYVPEDCREATLLIPINIAPWLWGWPDRFLDRMDAVGTRVYVLGPYGGEGFSQGLDDPALLERLPEGYSGGISTDAIDIIAPALSAR